ncbi:MAG: hypothetical protein QXH20_04245 [Candidatus Bathyarchaeia archaeon]
MPQEKKNKAEVKHVYLSKEVWKMLHQLKYRWDKETISDVIQELLERLNLCK